MLHCFISKHTGVKKLSASRHNISKKNRQQSMGNQLDKEKHGKPISLDKAKQQRFQKDSTIQLNFGHTAN